MDMTLVAGFDWDDGNLAKCQMHGLTIAEIEAVFFNPLRIAPDPGHSATETRFLAVGSGLGPRPVFVAFTLRDRDGQRLIRPISARYMHRKEIESYEAAIARPNQ